MQLKFFNLSDPVLEELKKDIKKYGRNITQHYLPLELLETVSEELNFTPKFQPNQLRIRKINNKYSIGAKSKGNLKRSEFEKTITKEEFKTLEEFREKTIKKIRLMKKTQKETIFFDYYPKHSLIVAEIEFENEKTANNYKTKMKDITGVKEYKNRTLAE